MHLMQYLQVSSPIIFAICSFLSAFVFPFVPQIFRLSRTCVLARARIDTH
jgi:membrane protein YqaA with SNARE-associated domain